MERKLLSLPNFFVLLLVAGIAFLAAPVVDVHATAPKVTAAGLTGSVGQATIGTDGATTAGTITVTIPFDQTVKISSGALTSASVAGSDADGFGFEDLTIQTFAADATAAAIAAGTGGVDLSPALTNANVRGDGATDTTSDTFTVTFPVPALAGKIKIAIASGAVFEDTADDTDYVYAAADHVVLTFDGTVPTVAIARSGLNDDGTVTGRFEVTFTLSSDVLTTGDGAFTREDITFSDIPTPAGGTPPATPVPSAAIGAFGTRSATNTVRVLVDPADGVESVGISVKAGRVRDAGGNGNAEASLADDVPVDNTNPTVTVEVGTGVSTTPGTPPTYSASGDGKGNFTVFFILSEAPSATTGDEAFLAADIEVTGGSIASLKQIEALDVRYEAMVNQDGTTETTDVVLSVPAGAFEDEAGNGNDALDTDTRTVEAAKGLQPLTVAVKGGSAPRVTVQRETPTGVGTELTSPENGFSFEVNVARNEFVVLARSPGEDRAGFTSAAGSFTITYKDLDADPPVPMTTLADDNRIDIDDDIWVDLRHFFVGREGGSIDLIGPAGRKVRDLVISEVMWGNDNGLSPPADSQWIELYNTTDANISGTWKLKFNNKSKGADILANGTALTSEGVVDKLSTWRNVGSTWAWRIEDTAGGKYGQSGKSTLNSATSPGSPVELISMQRKIDYNKVEKSDHDNDTAKNRTAQLKDFPNGAAAGGWEATKEHGNMHPYRKGTPGDKPVVVTFDKTGVPRGSVVFNEIANREANKYDWIELYNKSGSDQKITGWELSVVQVKDGKNTDTELFTFTAGSNGDDIVVPAKGYLLVLNTKPKDTPLEGGYNVTDPASSERRDAQSRRPYYITDKLAIPNDNFLLILRKGNDKTGTHEKIEDIAGNNPSFEDASINTEVWPLRSWTLGAKDDLGKNDTKTWVRDQGKDVFHGDAWKPDGGFTGVGIERQYEDSDSYTSGTPGYANNAVQNEVKSDGLTESTPVVISEIMFAIDPNGRVPQWIELHNPSHTQAVNLNKWKLEIVNYHGDTSLRVNDHAELVLPEKRIQPNQTVLIVSRETSKVSGSSNFPDDRIIGIWNDTDLRKAMGMDNARDAVLSSTGFHIKLSDPKKVEVDEVGNIDANQHNADEPAWTLPGGFNDDGNRSSMVRAEDTENDGEERDSWRDANAVTSSKINPDANDLYYGASDDIGTPGYTPGGVLPVQLSSFYSKRNDAGAVIITWSTESELDNAGFNILRSLSRVGEFTRINAQLIPGAGTTGEKNTYTWTDTSARPNVVYYYQIEDVSLDGDHRTLRTTRLRGYVGAAGKATTIWGELKSRD